MLFVSICLLLFEDILLLVLTIVKLIFIVNVATGWLNHCSILRFYCRVKLTLIAIFVVIERLACSICQTSRRTSYRRLCRVIAVNATDQGKVSHVAWLVQCVSLAHFETRRYRSTTQVFGFRFSCHQNDRHQSCHSQSVLINTPQTL